MLSNGNLEDLGGDVRMDGRMDGHKEIHPCVLQDIGPLRPLPKKEKKKEEEEKISHLCESIGHRLLRGRCPKGKKTKKCKKAKKQRKDTELILLSRALNLLKAKNKEYFISYLIYGICKTQIALNPLAKDC